VSGSNNVNRDTALATCEAKQYWLPEIFTKRDLSAIETAAGFSSKFWTIYLNFLLYTFLVYWKKLLKRTLAL
jgi:hypothetical protein